MKNKILLIAFLLNGCSNVKSDLYQRHLSLLNEDRFENSAKTFFDINGVSYNYEDKYKIQVIFTNPRLKFNDITIMMLDNRFNNATNAPLNLGYYNEEPINFVPIKENANDQDKIRFTFLSDLSSPCMKIAFSYVNINREEVFLHFDQFMMEKE